MYRKTFLAALILALAFAGADLRAQDLGVSDAVLASDGAVYTVQAGTYGALFPDGSEAAPRQPVLALQVRLPDGSRQSHLVPGTGEDSVEGSPSLIFEEATGTLYLLWESWTAEGSHSRLHLVGFEGELWQGITEMTGSAFVLRSSPRFALTRDEVSEETADGGVRLHQRSVLHLFWIEDEGGAGERVLYAPQFLIDGELALSAPPRALNEGLPAPPEAAAFTAAAPLLDVRKGQDPQSLVVTFADRGRRQLAAVELRVVPGEISGLAAEIEARLAAEPPGGPDDWVRLVRNVVGNAFGDELQDAVRKELGDQVAACILAAPQGTTASELAGACGERLLGAGLELDRSGIKKVFGEARPQWIGVGYGPGPRPGHGGPGQDRQHVAAQLASTHAVPQVMAERPVSLLTSTDGRTLVAFWKETVAGQERLAYQEIRDGSWSPTRHMALSDELGPGQAVSLLRNRLERR